jgi:hypothetical protein
MILLLALVRAHSGVWTWIPGLFLFGAGVGTMLTSSVNVVQSSFPEADQGEISGLSRSVCTGPRLHSLTGDLGLLSFGLRHETHVDYVESQAVDPLHQPGQSAPIRQFGPEGGRAGTYGYLAILELRAQRGARLSQKRDLIRLCLHRVTPPRAF